MPMPSDQPIPSRRVREGLAPAIGRKTTLTSELDEHPRRSQHRHPAGQRQRTLPARSDWHAKCNATSEEEQAVSTDTAGPSKPKV